MAIRKLRSTHAEPAAPSEADLDAVAEEQKAKAATGDEQDLIDFMVAHGHTLEDAEKHVAENADSIRQAIRGFDPHPVAPPPPTTPAAHPPMEPQDSVPGFAPDSVPGAPSFLTSPDTKWSDGKDTS